MIVGIFPRGPMRKVNITFGKFGAVRFIEGSDKIVGQVWWRINYSDISVEENTTWIFREKMIHIIQSEFLLGKLLLSRVLAG